MQVAEHQIANSMNVRMLRIHVPDGSQTEDAHGLVELLSKSISSSILVADLISPPIAKVDSALLRKTLEKPTMSEEVDEGLLREAREVLRRSEEPPAASKAPVKDSFWRVAARTQMQPSESLPGAEQAGTSRNASSMVLSNLRSESDLKQVEEMRVSLTAALSDLQFKISDEEQRATAVEALSARLLAAETKQAEVAARPAEEIRQLGQASEGGDEYSIDQATEGGDEDKEAAEKEAAALTIAVPRGYLARKVLRQLVERRPAADAAGIDQAIEGGDEDEYRSSDRGR